MSQLSLEGEVEIPEHRIMALAGVLAGFRWPDRSSFDKLKTKQKAAALRIAKETLVSLAAEED